MLLLYGRIQQVLFPVLHEKKNYPTTILNLCSHYGPDLSLVYSSPVLWPLKTQPLRRISHLMITLMGTYSFRKCVYPSLVKRCTRITKRWDGVVWAGDTREFRRIPKHIIISFPFYLAFAPLKQVLSLMLASRLDSFAD